MLAFFTGLFDGLSFEFIVRISTAEADCSDSVLADTRMLILASEELGIPIDKITVKWGDTDLVPRGGGTGGSRSLQLGGSAVRQASRELLDVARERAADTLEVSGTDLIYDTAASAFSVRGDPDISVPLSSLAESERLYVYTVFTSPGATFPFGSHVAVVEVDMETGKVYLRRVETGLEARPDVKAVVDRIDEQQEGTTGDLVAEIEQFLRSQSDDDG